VNLGTLHTGWNVMSLPLNSSFTKSNLIVRFNNVNYSWTDATTGADPIILGYIYCWSSTDQTYQLSNVFTPGSGYWMYAYHDCVLKKGG
jgi:hypothetical protein